MRNKRNTKVWSSKGLAFRDDKHLQNGLIFRKVLKRGGRVIFNPKIYIYIIPEIYIILENRS